MAGSNRIVPLPGIVRDKGRGKWEVREMKRGESPKVDLKNRLMIVPFGDSELESNARQHEMGHAAWTAEDMMKRMLTEFEVSNILVQGVEDARINTNLGNLGLPQDAECLDFEALDEVYAMLPQDQLALLFATLSTGDEANVREVIQNGSYPQIELFVDAVLREAGMRFGEGEFNDEEVTHNTIRLVAQAAQAEELPPPEPETVPGDGEEGEDGKPEGGAGGGDGDDPESLPEDIFTDQPIGRPFTSRDLQYISASRPSMTYSMVPTRPSKPSAPRGELKINGAEARSMISALESVTETNDGVKPIPAHLLEEDGVVVKSGVKRPKVDRVENHGKWTAMEIIEPSRPNRVPARVRGRARGVNDTGAVPTAIHRLTSDGRVFRATRIKPMAGAVLIDNSGSMGFVEDDLVRIMAALPAATIADYCSSSYGQLRILARKGRMVKREILANTVGSGNGCDGLALRWLVQQQGPRFWVSDGGITGHNDMDFSGGAEECMVLCRAGKVAQFESIEQLERMLENGTLSLRRHPPLRDADRPPYNINGYGG